MSWNIPNEIWLWFKMEMGNWLSKMLVVMFLADDVAGKCVQLWGFASSPNGHGAVWPDLASCSSIRTCWSPKTSKQISSLLLTLLQAAILYIAGSNSCLPHAPRTTDCIANSRISRYPWRRRPWSPMKSISSHWTMMGVPMSRAGIST